MNLALLDLVTVVSTVLDVAVVATIGLRRTPDGTVGMARVGRAFLVLAVLWAAKLPVLSYLHASPFGLIRVVYADLVVGLPCLGLLMLTGAGWRGLRLSSAVRALCFAALLGAPIGVYATWIEPYRLQVETADVTLPVERVGQAPVRIGILADLQTDHVGDHEWHAITRLMSERPDVILIPGDVFHGYPDAYAANREQVRELLRQLRAPGGVFVVRGDTDIPGRLPELIEGTAVEYLREQTATVRVGDRTIRIAGVTTPRNLQTARAYVAEFAQEDGRADIRIVVGHHPDIGLGIPQSGRIDLVVAGHTHGGQVVVPFLGPIMTLTDVPRHVAAGGLHLLDGARIYVSRGVGAERTQAPQVRFLCPPEVAIVTLR